MKRAVVLLAVLAALPASGQQQRPAGSAIEVRSADDVPGRSPARTRAATAPDLEVAYRAFAVGDLKDAERMLTQIIEQQPSPAAYLLRGCTRFTAAMLARDPGNLSEGARADVRRAYELNPSIYLDPKRFSPRLIAFLDTVRQ